MSKRAQQRWILESTPVPIAIRAREAMQQGNFKDAIKLLKQLVRQEPTVEARNALDEAYAKRARELAAKGMFEEAEIVLGNTAGANGAVRDPLLYLQCLIKRGQHHKAAEHSLIYVGTDQMQEPKLAELAAALLVSAPLRLDRPADSQSERARWMEHAIAARQVLAAWIEGKPHADIDQLLSRIPMRSAFKALRLIVKALMTAPDDPERAAGLLDAIPTDSPFVSLRLAMKAALAKEPEERLTTWNQLSKPQQAFVLEISALPEAASRSLAQLVNAERGGPGSLFSFLSRQATGFPADDVKNACLNLLPLIPDRVQQFEKVFGPVAEFDKNRILALSAERRNDWRNAEQYWLAAAQNIAASAQQGEKLALGSIYRHLADLVKEHPQFEVECLSSDSTADYLEQSRTADPDHLPTVLRLLALYRTDKRHKHWERLAQEAAKRFPDDRAVLLEAIDAAVARKAYKKAVGFAKKLLVIDPINQPARQRMIDLQVSHAHRQMRSGRADLAMKELASAAEWERADNPSAVLRINLGLVGLALGEEPQAEAQLRQGVDLAGGGVAGWFCASLQDLLMRGGAAGRLRQELVRAQETAPTKQAILSIVSAVGREEVRGCKKALMELVFRIRGWLLKGAALPWSAAEFHLIADLLQQGKAHDLLGDFVRRAMQREPADPTWRLYQLLARTEGDADKLSMREMDELINLSRTATERNDLQLVKRIRRFIEEGDDDSAPHRGSRRDSAVEPLEGEDDVLGLLISELDAIAPDVVRSMVARLGRNRAATALAGRLRALPMVSMLPESMLRRIAEAMIDSATARLRVS
jgi:cellulose synthase operon protein C